MTFRSETIAAISTPYGRGGIGIVRLSGPDSLTIASKVTQTRIPLSRYTSLKTRKQIHGLLLDRQGTVIDEILISIHPASRSFTGEMAIEINCHGGPVVLEECLMAVIDQGARIAAAGEFTRRAVENGRMDLIQAEAINDLIQSRSRLGVKMAWSQMDGRLSNQMNGFRDKLKTVLGEIVFRIDFEPDSAPASKDYSHIEHQLQSVLKDIQGIIQASETSKVWVKGAWVVLYGPQNAGKSSIFNLLLQTDRSIVCDYPGTTRDHVSESMEMGGIEIRLIDTAGIHDPDNEVDRVAVNKSVEQMRSADLVLYILDQSKEWALEQEKEAENVISNGGVVVLNKSDLQLSERSSSFLGKHPNDPIIQTSVALKTGFDTLVSYIVKRIRQRGNQENPVLSSERQIRLLKNSGNSLEKALVSLEKCGILDQVQYEVETAILRIDEIIGNISSEEVLNDIFSKFCVGK